MARSAAAAKHRREPHMMHTSCRNRLSATNDRAQSGPFHAHDSTNVRMTVKASIRRDRTTLASGVLDIDKSPSNLLGVR